jgi:hypothetical protein
MRQNRTCWIEGIPSVYGEQQAISMTPFEQGRPSLGQAVEMYENIFATLSTPVGYLAPGGIGNQAYCNVRQMTLICSSIGRLRAKPLSNIAPLSASY